jgi:hypothetical protein
MLKLLLGLQFQSVLALSITPPATLKVQTVEHWQPSHWPTTASLSRHALAIALNISTLALNTLESAIAGILCQLAVSPPQTAAAL